jgi:hypothetical protein
LTLFEYTRLDYPLFEVISGRLQLSGIEYKHKFWLLALKVTLGSQIKTYVRARTFGQCRKPQEIAGIIVCPARKSGASISQIALS